MTRRNARTAGLIAAAAVVLLWSAWRIVDARLNVGTAIAAWSLWLVLAVALASAVAYLRELVQHRGASRRVGWRPVPGVALLWIAGLATVAVFGFLMPDAGAASTRQPGAGGRRLDPAPAIADDPVLVADDRQPDHREPDDLGHTDAQRIGVQVSVQGSPGRRPDRGASRPARSRRPQPRGRRPAPPRPRRRAPRRAPLVSHPAPAQRQAPADEVGDTRPGLRRS